MEKVFLCFDIGGTFIKYGVFDQSYKWVEKGKFPTIRTTKDAFFDPMVKLIQKVEEQAVIQAIGLSFPGFINPKTSEAILAGAIAPLHGSMIREELLQRLTTGCPILIENDANCAALAEVFSGKAQSVQDFVLLTIGTGIGGAIVHQQEILTGHSFRSGEFGMMVTDYHEKGYKNLHDLASMTALVTNYRALFHLDSTIEVTGEQIFSEAQTDERVKNVVDEWISYICLLIYNVVVTLNPEKVLIGGGVSNNVHLIPLIQEKLQQNKHWKDFLTEIDTCSHYNDAGLLGALYLVKKEEERHEVF